MPKFNMIYAIIIKVYISTFASNEFITYEDIFFLSIWIIQAHSYNYICLRTSKISRISNMSSHTLIIGRKRHSKKGGTIQSEYVNVHQCEIVRISKLLLKFYPPMLCFCSRFFSAQRAITLDRYLFPAEPFRFLRFEGFYGLAFRRFWTFENIWMKDRILTRENSTGHRSYADILYIIYILSPFVCWWSLGTLTFSSPFELMYTISCENYIFSDLNKNIWEGTYSS